MYLRILSFALATALPVFTAHAETDYVPMKVIQTDPIIVSPRAAEEAITSGEVRVSVQVDATGKLTDYLVTAYTHPILAESVVHAVKHWKYEPAWLNGQPRSATVDLTVGFESKGMVVVSMTVNSYLRMLNYHLQPSAYKYGAVRLGQLDRIPTPTKVVQPLYAANSLKEPARVTVQFYIDEEGGVRLPAVSRETNQANEALSAAAVEAVSQWKFEPPTSKGKPVLVSARQDFNFEPKK